MRFDSRSLRRGVWMLGVMVAAGLGRGTPAAEPATPAENGVAQSPAKSADLRPVFRGYGLEPRAQGARGTCSVFAVTSAMELAVARKQGRSECLSVEFLNWAANKAADRYDDGGFFSELWMGYTTYGICPEDDMPYATRFDPAAKPTEQALRRARDMQKLGLRLHWIKPWDVKTGLTEREFSEIKQTLQREWPVCGGFRWPIREHWQDGVLQMAPPEGVHDGHSVLLVGFRDDPAQPGGGVFLIRNSGKGQGDASISYEFVRTYMNDAVWIDYEPAAAAGAHTAPWRDLLNPCGPAVVGRNRRVSSNQQPEWNSENLDMTWLQPHQAVEMPALEGPGVITHIWFTSHAGWVGELNALTLRIYWDGRKEPGVEVPLGDFFAVGQGKPAVVESVPVQVSPTGALSCYWRMPFGKAARIVVTNDNPDRSTGLYWQVDWVQVEQLPPQTPYFHARYRQEHPAVAGRDYVIADLAGTGYYVGTVLSVTLAQDGWFGEGDDFFFIDGEQVPSLQGTGSEDYFNDAWGFRPRTGHWFGQPRWQGDSAGDSGVCYRWHLPDPVHFSQSLKVAIEHKGNREESEDGFFLERPDFFSSLAYWYQTGEPKPLGQLPAWHERRVPWQQQHLVRTFRQAQTTGDAKVKVETTGFFGARPVLAWPNKSVEAKLTLPFEVTEDGRYALRLTAGVGPEYGRFVIELDGQPVRLPRLADFHAEEAGETDLLLGTHTLTKGGHTLAFRPDSGAPSHHPKALAVELLRLLRLPPEAKRDVRTHHEAHFVRLGIGRAVYAYRLAYDGLPDSLQQLVDCGIMPARYLNDENNRPLKSRLEDGFFTVESPAAGGWQHRWQGLDARR